MYDYPLPYPLFAACGVVYYSDPTLNPSLREGLGAASGKWHFARISI